MRPAPARFLHGMAAWLTLQGLVASQGEFSFGVPQFPLLNDPVVLTVAGLQYGYLPSVVVFVETIYIETPLSAAGGRPARAMTGGPSAGSDPTAEPTFHPSPDPTFDDDDDPAGPDGAAC